MVVTGDAIYRKPLKPRIRLYSRSDSTYTSPIYEYDPFTAGTSDPNKPNSLIFETGMGNVGAFTISLENNNSNLLEETFLQGRRIRIDCSKDGSTWQDAFKGITRGAGHEVLSANLNAKNLIVTGYNNLVRGNERLLNVIKESTKVAPGGQNDPYDRTDSNMFTNNLVFNLLNTDANYVPPGPQDDTQLYNYFKRDNVTASPITTWVPIVNAEFTTVNEAIARILEFSGSVLMMNFSNDQVVLYNSEQVTSDVQVFMITSDVNKLADNADTTMYPDQPYTWNQAYDFADSANKLVISYKDPRTNVGEDLVDIPDCPDTEIPGEEPSPFISQAETGAGNQDWFSEGDCRIRATTFQAESSTFKNFRTVLCCSGNVSSHNMRARVHNWTAGSNPGSSVGSDMILYRNADSALSMPTATTAAFMAGLPEGVTGPTLTAGNTYWIALRDLQSGSTSIRIGWNYWTGRPSNQEYGDAYNDCSTYPSSGWLLGNDGPGQKYVLNYATDSTTVPGCPGFQEPEVNYDQFVVARDTAAVGRNALIERAVTSIPPGTQTQQTLNEFLYAKLYVSAKPRFNFNFPSLTMPGKMPKAGDLVMHKDSYLGIGTYTGAVQMGVITSVRYEFGSDERQILGLRKLSLNTQGVKRCAY